ncbi:hypothetical protein NAP1_04275 [Erythrobacter sp. NAP1]|nr:hypothetical protein NAP1_04275 [Erythrobacter sp. NAP1]
MIALGWPTVSTANEAQEASSANIEAEESWAIALSGGGLRSSLFMIGALKALDQGNMVSTAPAISSVSGGSYANYWLYSRYLLTNPGDQRFGHYSLSDQEYTQRVCEIVTKGNFVTNTQIGWNWLIRNSVGLYQSAILRTYGNGDTWENGLKLSSFAESASNGEIPNILVNATIAQPRDVTGNDVIVTFTPQGISNGNLGAAQWTNVSEDEFPLYRMVAISGAAVGALKQWMPNPFSAIDSNRLRVWDGGKSENLGAFPLIVGGQKRVVIIDAEHDPNYTFGAYHILKDRLQAEGIDLEIPAIESADGQRLQTSYFSGTAQGESSATKIVYIKMALPETLDDTFAEQTEPNSVGWDDQRRFMQALEDSDPRSKYWDCANLGYAPSDLSSWMAYNTASYADYLNGSDGTATVFNSTGVNFLALDFPQYSTIDQSFYVDQSLAFIGLGYLQTKEFVDQNGS